MADDLRFPNQDLRNKDFDDLAAGDETHRDGDTVPFIAAEELEVGDLFSLNGDGEAEEYTDVTAGGLAGVVYSGEGDEYGPGEVDEPAVVESGDRFTGMVQGTVVARNASDTGYESAEGGNVGDRGEDGELVLDVDDDDEFVHLLLP